MCIRDSRITAQCAFRCSPIFPEIPKALNRNPSTSKLIRLLLEPPLKFDSGKDMEFYEISDISELSPGYMGIYEPDINGKMCIRDRSCGMLYRAENKFTDITV